LRFTRARDSVRSVNVKSESRNVRKRNLDRHAEGHFRAACRRTSAAEEAREGSALGNGRQRHSAPETGDRIRISGLGTLEVRQREARTGRNPATGEIMQIAASKKVAFRPAKELKEAG
jgi:hypothetical protein